ncbi:K02A2.6-like, partial [Cordylochernes scorpioides]
MWKSTVRVNGTAIHFKLDSGSDVTLIPISLYKRYFSNVQLTPTDGQLMAAANQRLENAGTFVAKLRANTREVTETVYVVHHLEQPLLGVGACEDLQLVRRIDLVINGTTDVNPEREFPKLFEGLGLLEQPYHIKLKEGAKPFSIPVPRRVPLPLMPKLKEQLDAMVAQEVIEPVDEPTEWCAPIVLAGKPNGKIRICVDLSRLNLSVEQKAFEKVKDLLASDRVLASFDISKKTMVSADASSYGLGAVLKQEHEANEWRPVAFASRTLTKTEQGYAQIEKEALAIKWACERFKDFVVGKTFLIETDHKLLVPIFTTKDLNDLTPRLQRYRMRMLQFSFHIFHTPGKDLITADALSRQPLPGHLPEDEELQEEVEHFVVRLAKLSSEAVVDHCKAIFARHGIPDIVISDNGPQFRPSTTSAFTRFASEVGFRHITSSPKHPQSNGQAEAAVKIVKNLMKKNVDPVLALMEYRATPLANGLSPAELLFGRKIRPMVPCTSSSRAPKMVDRSRFRGEEEQRRMAQGTAFDRRHAATKGAELIVGEKRRILSEGDVPLARVIEIALSMEAAEKNIKIFHFNEPADSVDKIRAEVGDRYDREQRRKCKHCGRLHKDLCRFREAACFRCGKRGHIATICRSREEYTSERQVSRFLNQRKIHRIKDQEKEEEESVQRMVFMKTYDYRVKYATNDPPYVIK